MRRALCSDPIMQLAQQADVVLDAVPQMPAAADAAAAAAPQASASMGPFDTLAKLFETALTVCTFHLGPMFL